MVYSLSVCPVELLFTGCSRDLSVHVERLCSSHLQCVFRTAAAALASTWDIHRALGTITVREEIVLTVIGLPVWYPEGRAIVVILFYYCVL